MFFDDRDFECRFERLAAQAIQIASDDYGVILDFTEGSLPTFFKLLERAHILNSSPGYEKVFPSRTIQVWGAYLGETIRRSRNGVWKENPAANNIRRYSVSTPTGSIFPMEQIYLRVVPGIQTGNLKAAIKEPPTIKAAPDQDVILLLSLAGLVTIFAGAVWFFTR